MDPFNANVDESRFTNLDGLFDEARLAIEKFNTFVTDAGHIGDGSVDHLCLQCGSREIFEDVRALLESPSQSRFFHQAFISGRRIAYFRLVEELKTSFGAIRFLELSDQKGDGGETTFDHVEIVPSASSSVDAFVAEIQRHGFAVIKKERLHHTTHDVLVRGEIIGGFHVKISDRPLIERIREEMR